MRTQGHQFLELSPPSSSGKFPVISRPHAHIRRELSNVPLSGPQGNASARQFNKSWKTFPPGPLQATPLKQTVLEAPSTGAPTAQLLANYDLLSSDLAEMCTLQLMLLYNMLSSGGGAMHALRASVYARIPASLGSGRVELRRVATFPPTADQDAAQQPGRDMPNSHTVEEVVVLHMGDSWRQEASNPGLPGPWLAGDEACLVQQEVLVLPHSNTLVLPLAEASFLVGLLVVEPDASHPRAAGGDSLAASLYPALPCCNDPQATGGAERDPEEAPGLTRMKGAVKLEGGLAISDEALKCLRLAAPVLAKACAMDLKAVIQSTQAAAQTMLSRGLLRDVQRGASALNTLSAMLLPRLKEGEPDRDIAKGIMMQGKRLQDLVHQLDAALMARTQVLGTPSSPQRAGGPAALGRASSKQAAPPPLSGPAPSPGNMLQQPGGADADGVRLLPRVSSSGREHMGSMVHDKLPSSSTPALPASSSPASSSSFSSSPLSSPATFPAASTWLPPASTSAATISTGPAISPPSPLERGVRAASAAYAARPPTWYQMRLNMDAFETIDVESDVKSDACKPNAHGTEGAPSHSTAADVNVSASSSSISPATAHPHDGKGLSPWIGGRSSRQAAPSRRQGPVCNVVDALKGILSAALRLARATGVNMVVQPPLLADIAIDPSSSGTDSAKLQWQQQQRPGAADVSTSRAGSSTTALASPGQMLVRSTTQALQPRPVRPIRAAVPRVVLRKILSYVIDIALQCTPQQGQLSVSAQLLQQPQRDASRMGLDATASRQQQQQQADASANLPGDSTLQVVILHTGKLVVDRLHPTSKPLFSSAASGAAARSGGAAQASAGKQLPGADPLLAHAPVRDSRAGAGPGARASGSGLLSFTMAEELVLGVGGTVHITYPVAMVNSYTGRNDSATAIVIELPAWST